MNPSKLEMAIEKVIEVWEKRPDAAATQAFIALSPSDVKSCQMIIDEAIRLFVSQNNL